MAVDWDALLVSPGQDIFSQVITVIPTVSIPANPVVPYTGRGVWSSSVTEVLLDDGTRVTTRTLSISIRVSEYTVVPVQGDTVSLVSDSTSFFSGIALGMTVSFLIDDCRFHGDGSMTLILKRVI